MAGFGYLRSANRDRYSPPEDAGPIGTTVWQVQLPGNPAINTGIVCAPTTNYRPLGDPGSSPPDKVTTVYFGSDDGYLNAVAINEYRSAQLKWRFPAEVQGVCSAVRSTPTLVRFSSTDWGICFGADNGRVYCIRDMGDEPALAWRSAPLGEEGSKVRAGPLFRGGKAQAEPEPGETPSIVLVGAISIQSGVARGRLVGLPVNVQGQQLELEPVAGYTAVTQYPIVGSVSYVADWVPTGAQPPDPAYAVNKGFVLATDVRGTLYCWHDNHSGLTNHVELGAAFDPAALCTGWPATRVVTHLTEVAAYFGTGWHDQTPTYGGFIYAAKCTLRWDLGTAQLTWRWTALPRRRIEKTVWTPWGIPPPAGQQLNLGFAYADACIDSGGTPYVATWDDGAGDPEPGDPFGMFLRVDERQVSPNNFTASATLIHPISPQPVDLRATPCVAGITGGNNMYFVTSAGYLYIVERSGAIAQCFPVYVGGTVGHPTDPYGARPHVAVDAEGIIYIGNNNGVMRALWAPHPGGDCEPEP